jgi:hypothetical protein
MRTLWRRRLPVSEAFEDYLETATIQSSSAWFGEAESVQRKSEERWKKEEHQDIVESLLEKPQAVDLLHHYDYMD